VRKLLTTSAFLHQSYRRCQYCVLRVCFQDRRFFLMVAFDVSQPCGKQKEHSRFSCFNLASFTLPIFGGQQISPISSVPNAFRNGLVFFSFMI